MGRCQALVRTSVRASITSAVMSAWAQLRELVTSSKNHLKIMSHLYMCGILWYVYGIHMSVIVCMCLFYIYIYFYITLGCTWMEDFRLCSCWCAYMCLCCSRRGSCFASPPASSGTCKRRRRELQLRYWMTDAETTGSILHNISQKHTKTSLKLYI